MRGLDLGNVQAELGIWRIVLEGVATLTEIETHWSIDDLADAHEVLDVRAAMQRAALEKR